MLHKLDISKEWTDNERLLVIAEIVRDIQEEKPCVLEKVLELVLLIQKLSMYTVYVLELTREQFADYVEVL